MSAQAPLPFSPKINSLLEKYINLDTSGEDGKNYPQAVTLLKTFLDEIGFETSVLPIPVEVAHGENRSHLIARKFQSEKLPTLVIYNHMDVVPAPYANAFHFSVRDGKIFGRGTSDHKGSTIAVLSALEKLEKLRLRFNLLFIATTDEETNQFEQLQYLGQHLNLPKDTLVFDPDTFAGGVTMASLGLMQLEIKITGKSAHSGMSHLGINAVEQAGTMIEYLKTKEKTRLEKQTSRFKSFPSTKLDFICSRCNVNQISGGTENNVVPDLCTITVDFRFIPEVDVATETHEILERLRTFCYQKKLTAELTILASCESYFSEHPEINRLNKIYTDIAGEGGVYGVLGSTHAAQWCKEMQVPHFGIGVARGDSNVHGVNECASVQDLVNLEKTMVKFLNE